MAVENILFDNSFIFQITVRESECASIGTTLESNIVLPVISVLKDVLNVVWKGLQRFRQINSICNRVVLIYCLSCDQWSPRCLGNSGENSIVSLCVLILILRKTVNCFNRIIA